MYKIEQGGEELNSNGGMLFIGTILDSLKGLEKIDEMTMGTIQKGRTSHSGILLGRVRSKHQHFKNR